LKVRTGRTAAAVLFFLAVPLLPLFPQNAGDESAGSQSTEQPAAVPAAGDRSDEKSLFKETLPQDILTASFYELSAWNERLGLSTRGGKEELQQRLFDYYGVSRPPETESAPQTGQEITIESAVRSDYFVLENIDQRYVRLRGGVTVQMTDRDTGVVHRIQADEIVFNQSENSLTANGNVKYVITREGGTEQFSGDTLTFYLDTWEGMFLEGTSTRTRTIEGRDLDFKFSGKRITRSPEDIVVMQGGEITSSKADPPNYHLRAKKIWVLGPGEWGLQNAVLYVGRIPVLYLPFFFRPGDRLFFHPAIGHRSRAGNFIQTTTYLIGNKPAEETPISFLQIASEGQTATRRVRKGLFLTTPDQAAPPVPEDQKNWVLKALADVYTNIGAYLGLEGNFGNLGLLDVLNFSFGIAESRNVYNDPLGSIFYTPRRVENGDSVIHWNSSDFAGLSLPFRYKLSSDFRIARGGYSGKGLFELYSDPYVDQDFGDRAESINWLELAGAGEEQAATTPAEKSSLTWQLASSYQADLPELAPYISQARISNMDVTLKWLSKDIDPGSLPAYVTEADRSPEAAFYYPDTLVLPALSLRLSGTLFQNTGKAPTTGQTAETQKKGASAGNTDQPELRPPWKPEEKSISATENQPVMQLPPVRGDISGPAGRSVRYTVGYDLSPRITVENKSNDTNWNKPEDVDFTWKYSSFTTSNTGSVGVTINAYDSLFVFDGRTSVTGQYRSLYNTALLGGTEKDNLQLQAYQYSTARINENLSLTSYFLQDDDYLSKTNVQYNIGGILYRKRFEGLDGSNDPVFASSFLRWNRDFIEKHSVNFNLLADIWNATQSLEASADLPPREEKYSGTLQMITGPLTSSLSASVADRPEGWYVNPATFRQTLALLDGNVQFTDSAVYDVQSDEVSSVTAASRLWFVTGSYTMRNTTDYTFTGSTSPWQEEPGRALRPTDAEVGILYDKESDPMWKNRVSLSTKVNSTLHMNLLRFTESSLDFNFSVTTHINEFLDFTFSSLSRNGLVYQYVPALAEKVGRSSRNVFTDLMKSFNFFNRSDREDSFFNIQRLSVSADHHLDDWDLNFTYSGSQALVTTGSTREYRWVPEFSISLVWRPVPEFKSNLDYQDDTFTIGN